MNLSGLTDPIAEIARDATPDTPGQSRRIFGLLNAAKPAVSAALSRTTSDPLLLITGHPQSALYLAQELQCWTDRRIAVFPAIESLPYERVRLDKTVLAAREATAAAVRSGEADVVVAPVRALLQPVQARPSPAGTESSLSVAEEVQLDSLLTTWVETGYSDVALVDEPGTFARRGGVIDVFPAGAEHPIRIELFGNLIESMRTFDPETQRSLGAVEHVRILPIVAADDGARLSALESLMDLDIAAMNAESQTRWLDDLGRLEAGAPFDELAIFGPYLWGEAASLIDAFPPSALVVIDDPEETFRIMSDLWEQALDVQRDMERAGDLPVGLRPALLEPDVVRRQIGAHRCIVWVPGSDDSPDAADWSGLFTPARLYGGRIRSLIQDVSSTPQNRTVIATYQNERVEELLREESVPVRRLSTLEGPPDPGVTLLPGSPTEGWTLPSASLVLLTDYELFGRARIRSGPRKARASREAFFHDYADGDYVVHAEHGIGRFAGVTRMSIDGAEREYALVEYAGTDRLYVPTDQLERLTRYVGVGDAPPHVSRLGGGEWQRARQRASQVAAEIAGELIEIYARRAARPGHGFAPDPPWQSELESSFPYVETPDQARAVEEVKRDMEAPRPMDRLVVADVGYGKTEVAVRAAFKAVLDGRQVALLVPTTILAQQHFETFSERFEAFPLRIEVLSRFRTPSQQREILKRLASGEIDVLVGTHRLLQNDVVFKNLGLLIIDEEQRFGVRHKEKLKKLRESVDVLTLTATPIPRTLQMGLVGIREISVIETPPEGRLPIKTYLQPFEERLVREAVLRELDRDGQVYFVHNKVATIEAMAERVRQLVPEARILVGHGQMEEQQLERVMLDFARHNADLLISSTIIENGLDIPNVNTIVLDNAHRLGLTQLYQLRGRVGRSANQAYAYLLYPRDVRLTDEAGRRMEAIFEAKELGAGFSIAMKDLEIRGAGNLLGAQQSGHASAVGFDLFTRMIEDAVQKLQGVKVEQPVLVTVDLPLTMFLPAQYVGDERERLSLYRRLAAVQAAEELERLRDELRDRFGPMPVEVEYLLESVGIKLLAAQARVNSVSLRQDALTIRAEPSGIYDRVSLYRAYGMEAKVSTNVLRIPSRVLPSDWIGAIRAILTDMVKLRESVEQAQPVGA
jgi:transcription-repair coupling factor (superfamily II helicase)